MITDFLVIGSGIAGLSTALQLSRLGTVILVSKRKIASGCTRLAQGGIAGVRRKESEDEDSMRRHYEDTMAAGGFQNDPAAVELLVTRAPEALDFLIERGVHFAEDLHLEAGHRYPRVWHVADQTGLAIVNALSAAVRQTANIEIVEDAFVSDLLTRDGAVFGAECFVEEEARRIYASKTVLATGGAGQAYALTTNPREATGDGIALAVRAGAERQDMEFVQFHPTAFETEEAPLPLITEALRGAGARIVDAMGEEVCDNLLPRDATARAIFAARLKGPVYLDLSAHAPEYWQEHFPGIAQKLIERGASPEVTQIPVIPAAHFMCGGIKSDLFGRTNLPNLSVVGEVACTGVHGANRLASNSLLEGLVFAQRIAEDFAAEAKAGLVIPPDAGGYFVTVPFAPETSRDEELREEIAQICWEKVGIIRSSVSLEEAAAELVTIEPTGTETRNLHAVATFITEAARKRKKSLGCHFLIDEPNAELSPEAVLAPSDAQA